MAAAPGDRAFAGAPSLPPSLGPGESLKGHPPPPQTRRLSSSHAGEQVLERKVESRHATAKAFEGSGH